MPVCIAGMHRSGTSMVAQLLHRCGLYLGPDSDLIQPGPDNQDGYWENVRFVNLNDDILNSLGAGWDHPPLSLAGWSGDSMAPHRTEARALLEEFSGRDPWGWKDPRNSILLHFWQALIPDVRVVLCVRNPLEVCLSLKHRNYLSFALSLSLWMTYNKFAIECTEPSNRIVTHCDSYFDDTLTELKRLTDFLEIPAANESLITACGAARMDLHHHRFTTKHMVDAQLSPELLDLYAALCQEACRPTDLNLERPVQSSSDDPYIRHHAKIDRSLLQAHALDQGHAVRDAVSTHANERAAEVGATDTIQGTGKFDTLNLVPERLVGQIRGLSNKLLPSGARVLVVSEGDDRLLDLDQLEGWHFPRKENGQHAEERPSNSAEVTNHLEALRAQGAGYLLVPSSAIWWLLHYGGFRKHLEMHYRSLWRDYETCLIFALDRPPAAKTRAV